MFSLLSRRQKNDSAISENPACQRVAARDCELLTIDPERRFSNTLEYNGLA
jgi:hypothetical protein